MHIKAFWSYEGTKGWLESYACKASISWSWAEWSYTWQTFTSMGFGICGNDAWIGISDHLHVWDLLRGLFSFKQERTELLPRRSLVAGVMQLKHPYCTQTLEGNIGLTNTGWSCLVEQIANSQQIQKAVNICQPTTIGITTSVLGPISRISICSDRICPNLQNRDNCKSKANLSNRKIQKTVLQGCQSYQAHFSSSWLSAICNCTCC